MYVQPTSEITLYDLTLDVYDGRSPIFTTAAKQAQYFAQHKLLEVPDCKYIKRTGRIRVKIDADEAFNAGYMSFKNKDFEDKVFYAFLGEPHYINNECYEYEWTIDFIQTWMFDVEFSSDFVVDREHLTTTEWAEADANPWTNEVPSLMTPEELPISLDKFKWNYKIAANDSNVSNLSYNLDDNDGRMLFKESSSFITVVYLTMIDFTTIPLPEDYSGDTPQQIMAKIRDSCVWSADANCCGFWRYPELENGVWRVGAGINSSLHGYNFTKFNSATIILGFDETTDKTYSSNTNYYSFERTLNTLTQWGCVSAILSVYKIPKEIIKNYTFQEVTVSNGNITVSEGYNPAMVKFIDCPSMESGYIHYKYAHKLYRMPYTYITFTSPNGDTVEYYFEKNPNIARGQGSVFQFAVACELAGHPVIKVLPYNYINNLPTNDYDIENDFEFAEIPIAPYNIDPYITQFTALAQQWLSKSTFIEFENSMIRDVNMSYAHAESLYSGLTGTGSAGITADNNYINANNAIDAERQRINTVAQSMPTAELAGDVASKGGVGLANMSRNANAGLTSALTRIGEAGVSALTSYFKSGELTNYQRNILNTERSLITGDAARYLAGDHGPNALGNYLGTLPPAAVYNYVGTNDPYKIYSDNSFFNIYFCNRKLRDEYLEAYTHYFGLFGYKSIRVGKPYFANVISNSQTNLPSWYTVDNKKITYFKCKSGHIHGVPKYVSEAWMAMLEYGMTFLNGDDLITIPT